MCLHRCASSFQAMLQLALQSGKEQMNLLQRGAEFSLAASNATVMLKDDGQRQHGLRDQGPQLPGARGQVHGHVQRHVQPPKYFLIKTPYTPYFLNCILSIGKKGWSLVKSLFSCEFYLQTKSKIIIDYHSWSICVTLNIFFLAFFLVTGTFQVC